MNEWQHGVCSCCDDATQCFSFMVCGPCMMATTYTQYQKGQKVNDASTCSNLFPLLIPLVNLGFAFSKRREYVVPLTLLQGSEY